MLTDTKFYFHYEVLLHGFSLLSPRLSTLDIAPFTNFLIGLNLETQDH